MRRGTSLRAATYAAGSKTIWETTRLPSRAGELDEDVDDAASRSRRSRRGRGSGRPAAPSARAGRPRPRGLSAWTVVIEPGWPVLTARRKLEASAPRSSPRMMRSGRMRSEACSRSSASTRASPSSPRTATRPTALAWSSCTSGVSSIRISRSSRGDLLQQGVEEGGLAGGGAAGDDDVLAAAHGGAQEPGDVAAVAAGPAEPASSVGGVRQSAAADLGEGAGRGRSRRGVRSATTCLRIARASGPRVAGGATICTRSPSGRVADSRGCSRLTPWWARLAIWRARRHSVVSSSSRRGVALQPAARWSRPRPRRAVDEDVGDVGPRQHGRERREIGLEVDAVWRGAFTGHGQLSHGGEVEVAGDEDADRRALGRLDGGRGVLVGLAGPRPRHWTRPPGEPM